MWENDTTAAERIPDTAQWERWILTLSECLRELLRLAESLRASLQVPENLRETARLSDGLEEILQRTEDIPQTVTDPGAASGFAEGLREIPGMAEGLRDTPGLAEELLEILQLPAVSVLNGLAGNGQAASFRAVSMSGFLTERIVSGGSMMLPGGEAFPGDGFSVDSSLAERSPAESAMSRHRGVSRSRRNVRTPYETARELQKQSELLLRT